jgi:DNA-binding response OmpR family regulator
VNDAVAAGALDHLSIRPTVADDPPLVERIWQVLDEHGMGVVRKADMEALTARLRDRDAVIARMDAELADAHADALALIRELRAAGDALAAAALDFLVTDVDETADVLRAARIAWEQTR